MLGFFGRLIGGLFRLAFTFVVLAVILGQFAPHAVDGSRFGPGWPSEWDADDYTPRRPDRLAPEEVFQPGIIFQVAEPKPSDSLGTAFKVGTGDLWLTANHVVGLCDAAGIEIRRYQAAAVRPGRSIPEADVAAVHLPLDVPQSIDLAHRLPHQGELGFHMGYPQGRRAAVQSRYMGEAEVVIGSRHRSPTLVWAEEARLPEFEGPLGGISGGPTLNAAGHLVGINMAASERRGRILTVHPAAIVGLLRAEGEAAGAVLPGQDALTQRLSLDNAEKVSRAMERAGTMRRVFCRVGSRRG